MIENDCPLTNYSLTVEDPDINIQSRSNTFSIYFSAELYSFIFRIVSTLSLILGITLDRLTSIPIYARTKDNSSAGIVKFYASSNITKKESIASIAKSLFSS
jgi:hypothetical protein